MPLTGAKEAASADCCCGGVLCWWTQTEKGGQNGDVLIHAKTFEFWHLPYLHNLFGEICMTLEPTLSNRLNTPNISKPKAVFCFVVGLWEERKRRQKLGLPALEAAMCRNQGRTPSAILIFVEFAQATSEEEEEARRQKRLWTLLGKCWESLSAHKSIKF